MRFTPLSDETEYTLPEGVFDLRGWEVRAMGDGEKVGAVDDLLIDDEGAVRYLAVDLITDHRQTLVPLERARADEAEMVVWVPGLSSAEFDELPSYRRDPKTIDDEFEAEIDGAYRGASWRELERGPETGTQDLAGIETPEPIAPRWGPLAGLSELGGFEVSPDDPDPRGWSVIFADQRRIGQVHDLIVEAAAGKVRYLDCEVTLSPPGHRAGGRHILIPISTARLDLADRTVFIDSTSSAELDEVPSFAGLPLAPEDEDRIHSIFDRTPGRRDQS